MDDFEWVSDCEEPEHRNAGGYNGQSEFPQLRSLHARLLRLAPTFAGATHRQNNRQASLKRFASIIDTPLKSHLPLSVRGAAADSLWFCVFGLWAVLGHVIPLGEDRKNSRNQEDRVEDR